METLNEFALRLSRDVSCYYHSNSATKLYSLKKYDTNSRGKMGVFGWVQELKRKSLFRIDTYRFLAVKAGVAELGDEIKKGMHYISEKDDLEGKATGISNFVKNGSNGEDYKKAVKLLKAVMLKKVI